MRVTHADGWSSGYAHLQAFSVGLNAIVTKGQQIGVLGQTGQGITGPHLHTDVKLNGVARDLWPLLDQQIAAEDDVDASFIPIPNRTVTVNKGGRHRLDTTLTAQVVYVQPDNLPLGVPIAGTVKGAPANGSDLWYAYWQPTEKRWQYIHSTVCGPQTPWEAAGGGFTQADLDKAYNEGRGAVQGAAAAVPPK
jgi:murein DD-endopeptidase MepM/ murein hydrolase activator NlpD